MVKILCRKCGKDVASLAAGSEWSKGTEAICASCLTKHKESHQAKKPAKKTYKSNSKDLDK